MVSGQMNIFIPEFTVAGVPYGNFFAHEWYLASDDKADEKALAEKIDANLKQLNDDYEVERNHALKKYFGKVVAGKSIYGLYESPGKNWRPA